MLQMSATEGASIGSTGIFSSSFWCPEKQFPAPDRRCNFYFNFHQNKISLLHLQLRCNFIKLLFYSSSNKRGIDPKKYYRCNLLYAGTWTFLLAVSSHLALFNRSESLHSSVTGAEIFFIRHLFEVLVGDTSTRNSQSTKTWNVL